MPGSDATRCSLRRVAVAGAQLAVLGAVLWAAACAATHTALCLQLYRYDFGWSHAHRYAGRLAETDSSPAPRCLLVGASNVREGFDVDMMSRAADGIPFFNGGTSVGTIHMIELMTDMLRWYRVRPDGIVFGLNSRMLVDRPFPVYRGNYMDFMDRFQGWGYVHFEEPAQVPNAARASVKNTLWPLFRLAPQANSLIRFGLYRAHEAWCWRPTLSRRAFEHRTDDLLHRGAYFYDDTAPRPDQLALQMEQLREMGLFDRNAYANPPEVACLRRCLDKALAVTPHVVVVVMPEHSAFRNAFGSFADEAFYRVLDDYKPRSVLVIDARALLGDEMFRDGGHLLPQGRAVLSGEVAKTTADYMRSRRPL